MMPSLVARPLRLAADAWPLIRRISIALSTSPSASARADLQSMTPPPVRSRSCLTFAAETGIRRTIPSHRRTAWRPPQPGRSRTRPLPGSGGLRLAGALASRLARGGRLLGLLAGALLGLGALALFLLATAPALFLRLARRLRLAP